MNGCSSRRKYGRRAVGAWVLWGLIACQDARGPCIGWDSVLNNLGPYLPAMGTLLRLPSLGLADATRA